MMEPFPTPNPPKQQKCKSRRNHNSPINSEVIVHRRLLARFVVIRGLFWEKRCTEDCLDTFSGVRTFQEEYFNYTYCNYCFWQEHERKHWNCPCQNIIFPWVSCQLLCGKIKFLWPILSMICWELIQLEKHTKPRWFESRFSRCPIQLLFLFIFSQVARNRASVSSNTLLVTSFFGFNMIPCFSLTASAISMEICTTSYCIWKTSHPPPWSFWKLVTGGSHCSSTYVSKLYISWIKKWKVRRHSPPEW